MSPAELLPQIYDELRRLAADKMRHEAAGHTLDATALVHEVFLKLGGERSFATKSDYFKAAAEAMRRILVDHARSRKSVKRGSNRRIDLDVNLVAQPVPDGSIEALDESLSRLASDNSQVAQLVQLRFFGGLTLQEASEVLGVSPRTADTWWAYARAWLAVDLKETEDSRE